MCGDWKTIIDPMERDWYFEMVTDRGRTHARMEQRVVGLGRLIQIASVNISTSGIRT